ncbi:MAG: DUF4091 domain-containing protein [Armatimonadota bacterium]
MTKWARPLPPFSAIATCASLALAGAALPDTSVPWHQPLSYDAGAYWRVRVPVVITNRLDSPLQGTPVQVTIADAGTAELIGEPVASLRVVTAGGTELLCDLQDSNGLPKRDGALAAGDLITIPAEADARAEATIFLYAGNPDAWLPPEWLKASLVNTGFESPDGDAPAAWNPWGLDAEHRMSLDARTVHGGKRAARCEVAAGAEPTWVKYMQGGIPVTPGRRYRFTAWVRAQGIQGTAGWYVHVDGDQPQVVNQTVGWNGTFDWRQVVIDFTVPEGGQRFSCGTLLHGSGVAWYDDASLQTPGGDAVSARVLPAETRRLRVLGAEARWPSDPRWRWRVPLQARNFRDADVVGGIISFDTRRVRNGIAKLIGFATDPPVRIADPGAPGTPLHYLGSLDEQIRVAASVPARAEKLLWMYIADDPAAPGRSRGGAVTDLPAAEQNLVTNPSMEDARAGRPVGWTVGEEAAPGQRRFTPERLRGGVHGDWCLRLTVPGDVDDPGWTGWRQRVPVKPVTRYILAGHGKTERTDKEVRIHGHFLRADGSLTERPFFSTQPGLKPDADWTLTSATVTTPADCAFIDIHLTMNCHGIAWHDAIVLSEAGIGVAGQLEPREPQRGLRAWAVNPLVKVFGDDLAPRPGQLDVSLGACRNEYEPFQVAVRAPRAAPLTITATPLAGPGGARIPPPIVYRIGRVPIDFPIGYDNSTEPAYHRLRPRRRGNDGWPGLWPDPLIPVADAPVAVSANVTETLLFDVHVPADAGPGEYRGTVRLRGGGQSLRLPVRLTVWPFTQPDEKHLPALYDLRRGRGRDIFTGPDRDESVRTWYRMLARYNVSPAFVEPYPTFEYRNGRVTMETAKFDEAAHYLLDVLHVNKVYTPRLFYACGWARPPKQVFGLEAFTPEYNRAWADAYRMFFDHLTAKGWRDKFVFYISDEPHETSDATITGIARIADMARAIAPDVPVYSSTWRYIEGLEGHVNQWGIGPHGSFREDKLRERRAAGDRFWFTTDGHMCTDTPLLAIERLLPWFCLKYDVEAYEFWGVSWWTYDPWERGWHPYHRQSADGINYRWVRYPNGDGFLAYPGEKHGSAEPLPSIRLIAARDGVDDYELFLALRQHADRGSAEAQAALDRVKALVSMQNRGGRYSSYLLKDPDAVQAARMAAGLCLP